MEYYSDTALLTRLEKEESLSLQSQYSIVVKSVNSETACYWSCKNLKVEGLNIRHN